MKNYHIGLLAYSECLSSTLLGFRDLIEFANAIAHHQGRTSNPIQISVISADKQSVTIAGGLTLEVHDYKPETLNAVVVPGFMFPERKGIHRYAGTLKNELHLLKQLHAKGCLIGANCVGAFLLAEAGLLNGKRATTSWLFESTLAKYYPDAKVDSQRILIEDAEIITTGAYASMHELAYYFISKVYGESIALKTRNLTLTPGIGDNQQLFVDPSFFTQGYSPYVERIHQWLMDNMMKSYSLAALADFMASTPRTLMRRYKKETHSTPLLYLQKQRIAKAKEQLLSSDDSIERIADQCGYQDVNAFRKLFIRETGERPLDFRNAFVRRAH